MGAPARNISPAVIGCQGLDILHMMRLKVACSLLMAEYIQAEVQEWKAQPVDVLVASTDDPHGQDALREAGKSGMPVIAITRDALAQVSISTISYGASVREIFQHLRRALIDSGTGDGRFKPRTFFHSIQDAQGKACMLDMGLARMLVDGARSRVTLLRKLPFEKYLQLASEPGWTISVFADGAVPEKYLTDAIMQHGYEDFCWQAAAAADAPLAGIAEESSYSLRAWPEAQAGTLPVGWLVAMAALLLKSWKPAELAAATGASTEDVLRILSAAKFTTLLIEDSDRAEKNRSKAAGVTAMFSRIASRFGLNFRKKAQG